MQVLDTVVEEVSRKVVETDKGSIVVIIEIVYYLVLLVYHVWVWLRDRNNRLRRVRVARRKKEWRSYRRRRVEPVNQNTYTRYG